MKVIVIGAGVVGVSTALALAEVGCEVTVVERNSGVAQETSYGNAGMVAPAYVTPWAAPGMPTRIVSMLLARDTPVRFHPAMDAALWRWIARWLVECRAARYKRNKARMQRLAFYSRDCLAELRTGHGLSYERTEGLLQLMRTERDARMAAGTIAFLKEAGVTHHVLTPEQCRLREPGLSDLEFAGGLYLPDGETGNCPLFTRQIRNLCEERGVRFEFGTHALRVFPEANGVRVRLRRDRGDDERDSDRAADAVVIASGIDSAPLLRRIGIRLPLYPVKGYSATVAIRESTYAPLASLMDETYKVAIVRMGNRIRIAGTAELGDRRLTLETRTAERALATLIKVARDWFPGAANYASATWWVGARPMLPDGPPVLGASRHPRVFVNLGHGSTGWAMAAGSARIVADVVVGREPEIDLDGLTLARYR